MTYFLPADSPGSALAYSPFIVRLLVVQLIVGAVLAFGGGGGGSHRSWLSAVGRLSPRSVPRGCTETKESGKLVTFVLAVGRWAPPDPTRLWLMSRSSVWISDTKDHNVGGNMFLRNNPRFRTFSFLNLTDFQFISVIIFRKYLRQSHIKLIFFTVQNRLYNKDTVEIF